MGMSLRLNKDKTLKKILCMKLNRRHWKTSTKDVMQRKKKKRETNGVLVGRQHICNLKV
jgi:hypothetical protein